MLWWIINARLSGIAASLGIETIDERRKIFVAHVSDHALAGIHSIFSRSHVEKLLLFGGKLSSLSSSLQTVSVHWLTFRFQTIFKVDSAPPLHADNKKLESLPTPSNRHKSLINAVEQDNEELLPPSQPAQLASCRYIIIPHSRRSPPPQSRKIIKKHKFHRLSHYANSAFVIEEEGEVAGARF